MREFTEKHHAFIVGSFYSLLTERFAQRGEAAFVHATQRYAEQRGARMAQRAIRDGRKLDFATYREYGEWVNTQTVKDEGCDNQGYVVSYSPDFDERVTQCPWAAQFKEMGLTKCGTTYCTYVDNSVCRGFNPILSSMYRSPCMSMAAVFKSSGEQTSPKAQSSKSMQSICGHSISIVVMFTRHSVPSRLRFLELKVRSPRPKFSLALQRRMEKIWQTFSSATTIPTLM